MSGIIDPVRHRSCYTSSKEPQYLKKKRKKELSNKYIYVESQAKLHLALGYNFCVPFNPISYDVVQEFPPPNLKSPKSYENVFLKWAPGTLAVPLYRIDHQINQTQKIVCLPYLYVNNVFFYFLSIAKPLNLVPILIISSWDFSSVQITFLVTLFFISPICMYVTTYKYKLIIQTCIKIMQSLYGQEWKTYQGEFCVA